MHSELLKHSGAINCRCRTEVVIHFCWNFQTSPQFSWAERAAKSRINSTTFPRGTTTRKISTLCGLHETMIRIHKDDSVSSSQRKKTGDDSNQLETLKCSPTWPYRQGSRREQSRTSRTGSRETRPVCRQGSLGLATAAACRPRPGRAAPRNLQEPLQNGIFSKGGDGGCLRTGGVDRREGKGRGAGDEGFLFGRDEEEDESLGWEERRRRHCAAEWVVELGWDLVVVYRSRHWEWEKWTTSGGLVRPAGSAEARIKRRGCSRGRQASATSGSPRAHDSLRHGIRFLIVNFLGKFARISSSCIFQESETGDCLSWSSHRLGLA
jgi:hypothetical protein